MITFHTFDNSIIFTVVLFFRYAWVDLESHWSEKLRKEFLEDVLAAPGTSVIGSHHFKVTPTRESVDNMSHQTVLREGDDLAWLHANARCLCVLTWPVDQ